MIVIVNFDKHTIEIDHRQARPNQGKKKKERDSPHVVQIENFERKKATLSRSYHLFLTWKINQTPRERKLYNTFVNKTKKGWTFREKEREREIFDGVVDKSTDRDMEKETNFGWIVVNMLANLNVLHSQSPSSFLQTPCLR